MPWPRPRSGANGGLDGGVQASKLPACRLVLYDDLLGCSTQAMRQSIVMTFEGDK
jgi:hypothetical protein